MHLPGIMSSWGPRTVTCSVAPWFNCTCNGISCLSLGCVRWGHFSLQMYRGRWHGVGWWPHTVLGSLWVPVARGGPALSGVTPHSRGGGTGGAWRQGQTHLRAFPAPPSLTKKHLELQERQYLQKAVKTASSVAPARKAEEPRNFKGFGGVDAPASLGRLSYSFPAAVLAGPASLL